MAILKKSMSKKNLIIVAGAFYIPKDNPAKPRGDDAHFFNEVAQVIGLADGVGGWSKRGIDAGEFARELMNNAADAVDDLQPPNVSPKEVLLQAFLNTTADGTSTACIISVAGNRLRAANLGDSGFLILRGGKSVFKSPVQQHRFNCPYQMGKSVGESPEQAEEIVVGLKRGDVIVAGTDGLFDNLFEEGIAKVVNACVAEREAPEVTAWKVATAAREMAVSKYGATPFGATALEAGILRFGGKHDDITVVVAYVV